MIRGIGIFVVIVRAAKRSRICVKVAVDFHGACVRRHFPILELYCRFIADPIQNQVVIDNVMCFVNLVMFFRPLMYRSLWIIMKTPIQLCPTRSETRIHLRVGKPEKSLIREKSIRSLA